MPSKRRDSQAPSANRLSRGLRLTGKTAFSRVLRSRRRAQVGRIILQAVSNEGLGARLGISVAKRFVRKAVERNRFKRLVREAFRTNGIKLQTLDLFVSLRGRLGSTRHAPERGVVRSEIAALFEQGARMMEK